MTAYGSALIRRIGSDELRSRWSRAVFGVAPRWAAAFLLLAAGFAKFTDELAAGLQPWIIALVSLELLFAFWLLSGLRKRLASLAASTLFVVFAVVAFKRLVQGSASCNCFGRTEIAAGLMLAVNVATTVALAGAVGSHAAMLHRLAALSQVLLTMVVIGHVVAARFQGVRGPSDASVVAFVEHLAGLHQELRTGSWQILVLQADCGSCATYLSDGNWVDQLEDDSKFCLVFIGARDDSMIREVNRVGVVSSLTCTVDHDAAPSRVPLLIASRDGKRP